MEYQLVLFDLANEHYGVDIATVEGIIKLQSITAVPRAPAFVEGVTNLRGEVLPVIDLRKRFGLPADEKRGKDTRIIVVVMGGKKVGMVVDAVSEVLRVSDTAIEPPSPIVTTVDSVFIRGIAKIGDRLVILLDLGQILTHEEKGTLQTLALPAGKA